MTTVSQVLSYRESLENWFRKLNYHEERLARSTYPTAELTEEQRQLVLDWGVTESCLSLKLTQLGSVSLLHLADNYAGLLDKAATRFDLCSAGGLPVLRVTFEDGIFSFYPTSEHVPEPKEFVATKVFSSGDNCFILDYVQKDACTFEARACLVGQSLSTSIETERLYQLARDRTSDSTPYNIQLHFAGRPYRLRQLLQAIHPATGVFYGRSGLISVETSSMSPAAIRAFWRINRDAETLTLAYKE